MEANVTLEEAKEMATQHISFLEKYLSCAYDLHFPAGDRNKFLKARILFPIVDAGITHAVRVLKCMQSSNKDSMLPLDQTTFLTMCSNAFYAGADAVAKKTPDHPVIYAMREAAGALMEDTAPLFTLDEAILFTEHFDQYEETKGDGYKYSMKICSMLIMHSIDVNGMLTDKEALNEYLSK